MSVLYKANEVITKVRVTKKGLAKQVEKYLKITVSSLGELVNLVEARMKVFQDAHSAVFALLRRCNDIRQMAIYLSQYIQFRSTLLAECEFVLKGKFVLKSHTDRSFGYLQDRVIPEGNKKIKVECSIRSVDGLDYEYTEHLGKVKAFEVSAEATLSCLKLTSPIKIVLIERNALNCRVSGWKIS
jgi:hypothetical protein